MNFMNFKTFFLAVSAVAASLSAAAQGSAGVPDVDAPNPCFEGMAFTLVVPLKMSPEVQVDYRWYRGDSLIEDATGSFVESAFVEYTIPPYSAYGDNVRFYFDFRLNGEATYYRSPVYVVSFRRGGNPQFCGSATPGAVGCGIIAGEVGSSCRTNPGEIGGS